MTHSLLILGTVALTLVCLALGAEFKGNETLPAENRPKMESTSGKKTKGEMLDDGVTGRLESENGQKRMDIKFAFLIECQEDGTPVGGKPISRLEEGSEDRDKLKIMAESGSNATKTDKLDVDLIDKEQRAPRRNGTMPSRQRRGAPQRDSTDDITSTEMNAQSQKYELDLDEGNQTGNGKRMKIGLTLVLAESDGTIEIGSERQAVKAGEFKMQFTLEYEFCGDGGRECFNDTMQPTVGKVLKACFEGKGSSGEDEDPAAVENTDDDLKKYSYSDGSIKFSYRYILDNGTIMKMPDDGIAKESREFDRKTRKFVCVPFHRPEGTAMINALYDPTASVDEETDTTTTAGAGHMTFTVVVWVFATILNVVH